MGSTARLPRVAGAATLVALLATGCASATESGGARLPQADSWSSVTGGPANQGQSWSEISDAPSLLWSRSLSAPAIGVASSDGIGTLFQATISDRGCNVFALTADTGRKQWCSRIPTDGPRITATVDGRGSLFLPVYGGVNAVAAEGEHRWFAPTSGVPTTVTLLSNRHLLVISHLGSARVINSHTGLETTPELQLAGPITTTDPLYGLPWCTSGERGCPVPGPAAVDTASATSYLTVWSPGSQVPDLVAFRFDDDTSALVEVWRTPMPEGRLGVPLVLSGDRREVYAHGSDGSVHAFSTADGSPSGSVGLGYLPDTPPALLPDGTLVSGGRTTTVWRGPDDSHDGDAGPSPVVAVRVGQDDADADVIWRRDDLVQLTNPAATPDGRVVVAVRSGGTDREPGIALEILSGADGATLDRIEIPGAIGPAAGLSIDSEGRIALTTALGALYVYR